jgi:hypothetical protein
LVDLSKCRAAMGIEPGSATISRLGWETEINLARF